MGGGQELTYGAVAMYKREYQRTIEEREARGDGHDDSVSSDANRGTALREVDGARVLHDIDETEDELELALEEEEEAVGSLPSSLARLSTTTEVRTQPSN